MRRHRMTITAFRTARSWSQSAIRETASRRRIFPIFLREISAADVGYRRALPAKETPVWGFIFPARSSHSIPGGCLQRIIQTAERRYRFPCRIIGKIKVCSGHQFLVHLSRFFRYLLFIAFKSFVHRDFADFSVKRQTDDGIYHDTDEKHLRKQRRLYVEREPAGKLLHHKLVDNL